MEAVLSSYLAHLAVERSLAANTLASYRRDLRRYVDHLRARGRAELDEVGEADVLAFLAALREGDGEHPALVASSAARASPPCAGCTVSLCAKASRPTTPPTRYARRASRAGSPRPSAWTRSSGSSPPPAPTARP